MKILITGGTGYIGSITSLELIKKGYEIGIFDNLERGHIEVLNVLKKIAQKDIKFYKGDLKNFSEIDFAIKDFQPDYVMHFAAYALVKESVEKPLLYYENNVYGGINLLKAMTKNFSNNLIFSSTCAIYGLPKKIPIPEEIEKKPINVYGDSKLAFENILHNVSCTNQKFKYASLRYFNAAGADTAGLLGEDHKPETHIIPLLFDTALGKRESFSLYGTDYETKDGTCIRDYIHVVDLADAHIKAMIYLENGKSNYFNLGTTNGYSNREIIKKVEEITQKKIKIEFAPRREGDPPILIADNSKAKKILGWVPKFGLNDIISSAWKWHKKKFN